MKALLTLSRWIFGLVFIFSGFVKGIDPWGFEYKLLDYLNSMVLLQKYPPVGHGFAGIPKKSRYRTRDTRQMEILQDLGHHHNLSRICHLVGQA
jgi:hypothetical protein